MSTPRPRPTVVTSPRSEITSPLSSTRRNGISTATLLSNGADSDISPSGHPQCHGSYAEMSCEAGNRAVSKSGTGAVSDPATARPGAVSDPGTARPAAVSDPGTLQGAGPVRPPVNFLRKAGRHVHGE